MLLLLLLLSLVSFISLAYEAAGTLFVLVIDLAIVFLYHNGNMTIIHNSNPLSAQEPLVGIYPAFIISYCRSLSFAFVEATSRLFSINILSGSKLIMVST